MKKLHNIKIKAQYAGAKLSGIKLFEIRENDRNYEVGDIVCYTCCDSVEIDSQIKDKYYKIIYITDYVQKDGYIVFGEREIK